MKMKKISSLMIMAMFLVGMVPAVFAQEDVAPTPTVIDVSSGRVNVAEKEPLRLRPVAVDANSVAGSGPESGIARADVHRIEKIDDAVEKTNRKRKVDSLIKKNKGKVKRIHRDLVNNYDEDKALEFISFAAHVNERAIDVLERIIDRAENSETYLANHPNALDTMEEIRSELYDSYDAFYSAVEDDAMSEDEYLSLTDELKSLGKKIKRFSQNDKVRAYAKNHREEITRNLKDRYGDNPKIKSRIERLENAKTNEERIEAMEDVRVSVYEVRESEVETVVGVESEVEAVEASPQLKVIEEE